MLGRTSFENKKDRNFGKHAGMSIYQGKKHTPTGATCYSIWLFCISFQLFVIS